MEAGRAVKEEGKPNDLIERIVADETFQLSMDEVQKILKPENFIGRADQQVSDFVAEYVEPVLAENQIAADEVELTV